MNFAYILKKKGYFLINIGRDSLDFSKKIIDYDYSQSDESSIMHDLFIVKNSEFAIITASGASYLADVFDKPYIYLNSWHISRPGGLGKNCIILPALLYKNEPIKKFDIFEQSKIENTGSIMIPEIFDCREYIVRNSKSKDLLNAVDDLIGKNYKNDKYYKKLSDIIPGYGFQKIQRPEFIKILFKNEPI